MDIKRYTGTRFAYFRRYSIFPIEINSLKLETLNEKNKKKKKNTNILKIIGEWHGHILIVGPEKKSQL